MATARLRVKNIVVHKDGDSGGSADMRFSLDCGSGWESIGRFTGVEDPKTLHPDFERTFDANYATKLIRFRVEDEEPAIWGGNQTAEFSFQHNKDELPFPQRTLFVRASGNGVSATLNFELVHDGIYDGLIFYLSCQGEVPGPRILKPGFGSESALVPIVQQSSSLVARQAGDGWFRFIYGPYPQRIGVLDGYTSTGEVRLLQPDETPSGTLWRVHQDGGDVVGIECQGGLPGPRWLDGNTIDHRVYLSPERYSGTYWKIV